MQKVFQSFAFLSSLAFFACKNQPVKVADKLVDSSSTTPAKAAFAGGVDNVGNLIDTLYITGNDFIAYYNNNDHRRQRRNKAVLQFIAIKNASHSFLTLGVYASENHAYTSLSPLLVLNNTNKGSTIVLVDSLTFGNQDLGRPSPGADSKMTLIRNAITDAANQVVVFVPLADPTKHLAYDVYVIKSTDFYTGPGIVAEKIKLPPAPITKTNPSPPATSPS